MFGDRYRIFKSTDANTDADENTSPEQAGITGNRVIWSKSVVESL
jgi:hypothetical protein